MRPVSIMDFQVVVLLLLEHDPHIVRGDLFSVETELFQGGLIDNTQTMLVKFFGKGNIVGGRWDKVRRKPKGIIIKMDKVIGIALSFLDAQYINLPFVR